MRDVKGIAQKYPTPPEIGTEFYVRDRFGINSLFRSVSTFALYTIRLEVVRVLQHRRIVVVIGRDVSGVVVVETLDEPLENVHLLFHRLFGVLQTWMLGLFRIFRRTFRRRVVRQ